MKILVVVAHPRSDSLTASMSKRFIEGLTEAGHEYEIADLYAEGFNPILHTRDEPDWNNPNKTYSNEVLCEMERISASDALVFIFPIWWYSMPAIMKGYIDRVWNYGFAYGPSKLPVQKIRWIALVGEDQSKFEKRNYHLMVQQHLNVGLSGYSGVGVSDSKVHFMYNTLEDFSDESQQGKKEIHYTTLLDEAYRIGCNF
ncbi:NAD(P)H oxidoreductase [Niallia circulans]|uniref:NAD(P)H oxidoreductase n=1 Tax=Niallia circulans TaxID=1397 RepID=UPI0015610288|nr:NAD(P)H oxidoreductase [Niallia circulans]NRG31497.1 NAD(P)H oxidoreductase [Niallia circulans]